MTYTWKRHKINNVINSCANYEQLRVAVKYCWLLIKGYTGCDDLSFYIDEYTEYCTQNIFDLFPKGDDAQVVDAILELFRKREDINVFNKKALYIYIREQIDVKTPKITKISNIFLIL